MALPLIPIILAALGGGAVADQALNEGDITRWLGGAFAGAAGDLAGGATEFAMEPVLKMIIHDETLAEEIAEAMTNGEYDRAMDLFTSNFDQVNYQGFVGLIAGGYMANSIASTIGLSGVQKLAVIAPIAMLAGTATTRLWGAIQDGSFEFSGRGIMNAIFQGQEEGAAAAAEFTAQNTPPAPAARPPVVEAEPE